MAETHTQNKGKCQYTTKNEQMCHRISKVYASNNGHTIETSFGNQISIIAWKEKENKIAAHSWTADHCWIETLFVDKWFWWDAGLDYTCDPLS